MCLGCRKTSVMANSCFKKAEKVNVLCSNEQNHVLLLVFRKTIINTYLNTNLLFPGVPFVFKALRKSKAQCFPQSATFCKRKGAGGCEETD